MAKPENSGERIASLEATVISMGDGIKELKKTVEDGFKAVVQDFEKTRTTITDLDNKYVTKETFIKEMGEVKKIATARLWQGMALTSGLSIVLTFLVTYFLTNIRK